jgi:hypothetical protein
MQERTNVERLSNTSQGIVPKTNQNMGIHTETTSKALCYADDVKSNSHVYSYANEFRYTDDGQSTRKAQDRPIIAEWQPVSGYGLQDVASVNRTASEGHLTEGYHKQPYKRELTVEDNNMISSGGVVAYTSKIPTHVDANRVS